MEICPLESEEIPCWKVGLVDDDDDRNGGCSGGVGDVFGVQVGWPASGGADSVCVVARCGGVGADGVEGVFVGGEGGCWGVGCGACGERGGVVGVVADVWIALPKDLQLDSPSG